MPLHRQPQAASTRKLKHGVQLRIWTQAVKRLLQDMLQARLHSDNSVALAQACLVTSSRCDPIYIIEDWLCKSGYSARALQPLSGGTRRLHSQHGM